MIPNQLVAIDYGFTWFFVPFFQSSYPKCALELSYVVIFISFSTTSSGSLQPALRIKCFKVVFLSHFYS